MLMIMGWLYWEQSSQLTKSIIFQRGRRKTANQRKVDLPIKNGGSFHSYVSLPEGIKLMIPGSASHFTHHFQVVHQVSHVSELRSIWASWWRKTCHQWLVLKYRLNIPILLVENIPMVWISATLKSGVTRWSSIIGILWFAASNGDKWRSYEQTSVPSRHGVVGPWQ